MNIYEGLRLGEWREKVSLIGYFPRTESKVLFGTWHEAVSTLLASDWMTIYLTEEDAHGLSIAISSDETGTSVNYGSELVRLNPDRVEQDFDSLSKTLLQNRFLESLTVVTRPNVSNNRNDYDIPRCVAPFHVHCYKAAYRRDYYTQFMSREDMLRLPAYKVTEREDGSVITQIYPDLMEGESPEALDYMERCAWHFDKYHRVYGSTIYTEPQEWAEGGFFYRQERRLFGPNGLDGVVPQDLGLL